jgi:hypothetical protein
MAEKLTKAHKDILRSPPWNITTWANGEFNDLLLWGFLRFLDKDGFFSHIELTKAGRAALTGDQP